MTDQLARSRQENDQAMLVLMTITKDFDAATKGGDEGIYKSYAQKIYGADIPRGLKAMRATFLKHSVENMQARFNATVMTLKQMSIAMQIVQMEGIHTAGDSDYSALKPRERKTLKRMGETYEKLSAERAVYENGAISLASSLSILTNTPAKKLSGQIADAVNYTLPSMSGADLLQSSLRVQENMIQAHKDIVGHYLKNVAYALGYAGACRECANDPQDSEHHMRIARQALTHAKEILARNAGRIQHASIESAGPK